MKTNLKKHRKIKEDINNKRFPVRDISGSGSGYTFYRPPVKRM